MTDEDIDCRAIFESIEADTKLLLNKDLSEKLIEDMIKAINDRVDAMHKQIDEKGDEFVARVIESFESQKKEETEKGKIQDDKTLTKFEKKQKEERQKRLNEIEKVANEIEKNYQSKMEDLLFTVDSLINKAAVIDGSCQLFQNSKLGELVAIGKDEFTFKIQRKLGAFLRGKNSFELIWDTTKNNVTYSHTEKDDPTHLLVHGTTCYTYYQTNVQFKEEDFCVELEYKINTNDNYFYLGIINQSVVTTSNCMCCTISNGFYIQPLGDVVLNAVRTNNSKLAATKGQVHNVVFRVLSSEKQMYITMDDKDEQGPFKISGDTFRFVSGSCNSVNGYIKITNSYYC